MITINEANNKRSSIKTKNYGQDYLFHKGNYEKEIFEFLMKADRLDKSDQSFQDIRYDVKRRQIMNKLMTVMDSNKVVFAMNEKPLPRSFKVFWAKDPKDKKDKIFIDVTGVIYKNNGVYTLEARSLDVLISYLVSALNQMIYFQDPMMIVNNTSLTEYGASCYAELFTYVIDFLRISGVDNFRNKCKYLASMFYLTCALGKEETEATEAKALKISGLSVREVEVIKLQLNESSYKNIKSFIDSLAVILHVEGKLTLDVFLDKWLYLYGAGTQFATSMYVAHANMMINAYIGAYLNNQKTIEKICGDKMVTFVKDIIKVEEGAI